MNNFPNEPVPSGVPIPQSPERFWTKRTKAGVIAGRALYAGYKNLRLQLSRQVISDIGSRYGLLPIQNNNQLIAALINKGETGPYEVVREGERTITRQWGLTDIETGTASKYMMDDGRHITEAVVNPFKDPRLMDVLLESAGYFEEAFRSAWEYTTRGLIYFNRTAVVPVGYMRLGTLPDLVLATISSATNKKFPQKLQKITAGSQQTQPLDVAVSQLADIQLFEELPYKKGTWGSWLDSSLSYLYQMNLKK